MTLRVQAQIIANYLMFLLVTTLLTSLQTSLWLQILGSFPAPQMWAPPLVYWCLYRQPRESIIMVYIVSALSAALTAMPISLILLTNMGLFVAIYLFKCRIYWSGPLFFMLVVGGFNILLPVIHIILSWTSEKNPITDPQIFEWIISTLLTMLVALPLFHLYSWFDAVTHKEQPKETGSTIV